jgi:transaldolase
MSPADDRLGALTAAGTSVWLDQIRRGMIESGELGRMVREDSLRGVTSNPAIFEKAILGSPDYDEDIAAAAREGLSSREVYRRLAVRDVQLAADATCRSRWHRASRTTPTAPLSRRACTGALSTDPTS